MIVTDRTPLKNHSSRKIQILVVEDERIIAFNLKESLESLGYGVVAIASSGEQAVEKATQLSPDLVLMDIWLKGNMDGICAAQHIWESLSIPVIYVTGHSEQSTLERAKVTAPFGYILKPLKERELYVAIETALQRYEQEQLLSTILKGIGDGVIVSDAQGRVQFLNGTAESLTGWQCSEARKRELTEVFQLVDEQTGQPVDSLMTVALQQGSTVHMEDRILLISKDGTAIPIGDNAALIQDKKGAITGTVVIFREISDRKQVEAAIRQQLEQEKKLNQLQNQIIHTVSHEYRTPLSTILLCSQLLENNVELLNKEKQLRNCQTIKNSVMHMIGLLEDIQTFNKAASGKVTFQPAPLNLKQFCRQLVQEYQLIASDRQVIQLFSHGKGHTACIDEKLLLQILSNLLSNALKYSSDGSKISLVLTCKDNQVIFQVHDDGIGIPQEDQPQIFEPFHRAENVGTIRGTGMGLAIVKKAVDLHGGTISFKSKVAMGTTFTVTLPRGRT